MSSKKNDNKTRIAVIGLKGLPAFGGAAAVGESIIDRLSGRYDFTVYANNAYTPEKTGRRNGFHQIVFHSIPFKKLNTIYYYFISALHALFLGRYDLIHLHHKDAVFILPLLRLRYKVVVTTHGMQLTDKWEQYDQLFMIQDRLFFRFANLVTCVSRKDESMVRPLTRKPVVYIPNGVTRRNPDYKPGGTDFIMFAAGRILSSKGCHLFLEALNEIDYRGRVVIAGDLEQIGRHRREILDLARDLDVGFKGLIKDKNRLFGLIKASRFFVFPSMIESMSMMLLEVAILKTPLICSDIPENKAVFNDNEVLYFRNGDAADLAEKTRWALDHPEKMKEMAGHAYQKLIRDHNWSDVSESYARVYERLLGNSLNGSVGKSVGQESTGEPDSSAGLDSAAGPENSEEPDNKSAEPDSSAKPDGKATGTADKATGTADKATGTADKATGTADKFSGSADETSGGKDYSARPDASSDGKENKSDRRKGAAEWSKKPAAGSK